MKMQSIMIYIGSNNRFYSVLDELNRDVASNTEIFPARFMRGALQIMARLVTISFETFYHEGHFMS